MAGYMVRGDAKTPSDQARAAIFAIIDTRVTSKTDEDGIHAVFRLDQVLPECKGRGLTEGATKRTLECLYRDEYIELWLDGFTLGPKMRDRYIAV